MNSDDLRKLIQQKMAANPSLRSIMKRIQSGNATFKDTADYSRIYSELLGKCLSENVLDLIDREAAAADILRDSFDHTNSILSQVQTNIDKKNGINIRPQTADFPLERVQQFSHSLVDPTVEGSVIQRRARSGTANISMSHHDDYMETNARFRSKAGLKCYIDRQTDGKCCKWCTAIAGRYVYGEEPHDVYRRHDNCGCSVIYENGRQRQDVWSKRTWEKPKKISYKKPTVISPEQARALEQEKLSQIRGFKFNSSSIDIPVENDIISLRDGNSLYKPVTQEAIDRVPKLDIFDDDEMNKRHQQAAKDLLTEVKRRNDVPVGTEFSIRYDKDMKPLKDEIYRQGKVGSVKLDDMDIPYHAFHNHGSDQTLSYNDLRKFANSENMFSLTAQGNLGSMFSIVSSDNADKIGYRTFLSIVGDEKIYEIKGVPISLSFLSDSANKNKVKDLISLLTPNQRGELSKAIISQSEKCLNGGVDYGIKYYKAKLAE